MKTQADDLRKEIKTLQVMLQHAQMMGDEKHVKEFQNKINHAKDCITHMM
jgi:hypothetical protein|tara:strand:- start:10236 stop:10385 length:150 start_codon:yes stop_codon:yes gene_type:complete